MIIADDEPFIRTGLLKLIEWEIYGIEIIGESGDGVKAYLQIKDLKPDIALIDISMPNMNGLELMEMCRTLEHPPKFIILSGFNDFAYVQKALQNGAVNYMLKPVDQDELIQTIRSTVRLLDQDSSSHQQYREIMQTLRNDVLIRILNNRIDTLELREKCEFVKLHFHCNSMHIGMLQIIQSTTASSPYWIDYSDLEACEKLCNPICDCYAAMEDEHTIILIFKDKTNMLPPEQYESLLSQCSRHLAQKAQTDHELPNVLSILSERIESLQALPSGYRDCRRDFEKQRIMQDFFQNDTLSQCHESAVVDYTAFVRNLENCKYEEMESFLHNYLASIVAQNTVNEMDTVKYYSVEFIICTMQELENHLLLNTKMQQQKQKAFQIVAQADTLPVLEKGLIAFFSALASEQKNLNDTNYSPMIQNALNYIISNYTDCNLSLKTLAGQMDVNAAYLGRQFSLETNEYFSDYLNQIRISHALHFLTDTTLKTTMIAEQVGFSNISYFFTIFKKITGGRPGDYRKNKV